MKKKHVKFMTSRIDMMKLRNDYDYRVSSDPTMRLLGWNVAAEDLVQIPEHWLTYEEPEASMHYLLALLYIAFTFFGNLNCTL